jgi:predicted nuclease with TOPRIM domain
MTELTELQLFRALLRKRRLCLDRCRENLQAINPAFRGMIQSLEEKRTEIETSLEEFEGGDRAFRAEVRRLAVSILELEEQRKGLAETWKGRAKGAEEKLRELELHDPAEQLPLFDLAEEEQDVTAPDRLMLIPNVDVGRYAIQFIDDGGSVSANHEIRILSREKAAISGVEVPASPEETLGPNGKRKRSPRRVKDL